jgi:hypothetical protein
VLKPLKRTANDKTSFEALYDRVDQRLLMYLARLPFV